MNKKLIYFKAFIACYFCLVGLISGYAQTISKSEVGLGWSGNSVNTVIFRNQAVCSYKNYQITAYYNPDGDVVLAKRLLGTKDWELKVTPYNGNIKDAHNCISLAIDSEGYIHMSWDQHDTALRYVKSISPLSLDLTEELSMTGLQEDKVTYPEFHNLPNGKLMFLYRSGASGRGNTVLNVYDPKSKLWEQIQAGLISGENQRSAYWQTAIDKKGYIHLSWVWRETWDVETNNNLCYAVSKDGGKTWENSKGAPYQMPITKASAEVAIQIPQDHNLINQTAMTVDAQGIPYIATYWSLDSEIPQYKVVYKKGEIWQFIDTDFHKTPFSLGGGGTKKIPMSRPKVLVKNREVYLLFRDADRNNKISLAQVNLDDKKWSVQDITTTGVGDWEPNYDFKQWEQNKEIHLFTQKVNQVDGEGFEDFEPQPVSIIEIKNL